ncbi:hypothetical protein DVF44_17720 [Salmonella enterica subsp. enterica serovar Schwarzengrund]|nr:hypothetical protein [Salmonella enterica subsp. enterica serovar Brandenburg]EBY2673445.1 hypothetical protein [Salmonella enterica subsp. enterica serovar Schwarzengrund]
MVSCGEVSLMLLKHIANSSGHRVQKVYNAVTDLV